MTENITAISISTKLIPSLLEHFLVECRETKIKTITTANQKKGNTFKSQ